MADGGKGCALMTADETFATNYRDENLLNCPVSKSLDIQHDITDQSPCVQSASYFLMNVCFKINYISHPRKLSSDFSSDYERRAWNNINEFFYARPASFGSFLMTVCL